MEIFVRGDNIEVTKAIQEYANEKLGRIEKYIGQAEKVRATVVASVKGHNQKVEVTIPLKTIILRAEETKDDLYAAIDIVADKLERQIRKNKAKLQKREKNKTKEFNIDDIIPIEEDEKVVKHKKISVKPMNEDEAVLQMELLGHDFYVYKDSDTNNVCVLYKRKDGGYGVIEGE